MTNEDRILDKLEDIAEDVSQIRTDLARIDERGLNVQARVVVLEKHKWASLIGLITGLTSIIAAGATAFINFFVPKG